MSNDSTSVCLSNNVRIPVIGFGTYKISNDEEGIQHILNALHSGYRRIVTASYYENEKCVGEAIRRSGIPREEIFVTTKLYNDNHGYQNCLSAFQVSFTNLGLDYIDLFLIHWPGRDRYVETWKAFEELYRSGKVHAIGVSNFLIHHLQHLQNNSTIPPMLNQIELHPYLSQPELVDFCLKNHILVEAWSPLARGGKLLEDPVILEIAESKGKTSSQIILCWHRQHQHLICPKTSNAARMKENKDIFDFSLTSQEMSRIDALNRNERTGEDPDTLLF